ncbi:MAG: DUF4918 family protein [Ignavibacteria bacterium]|nr:DUF4918 family protein [Ignavibacteria bacterium]
MVSYVDKIFQFYNEICEGKYFWMKERLEKENIFILDEFLINESFMRLFYDTYVVPHSPKIVICGINPGRKGAGKTGVPFLDLKSLSKLLNGLNKIEEERSAQFFYSIIENYGCKVFYSSFYVTNISCLGFIKKEKRYRNINYFDLPIEVQTIILEKFVDEMNLVKPLRIIPCSIDVEITLNELKQNDKINAIIENRLPHPYYCSIDRNKITQKQNYINTLNRFITL